MDRYEKEQAVREAVEMMKTSVGRPRFRAMIRRKVREAIKRRLWDETLELYTMIERLDEQDEP